MDNKTVVSIIAKDDVEAERTDIVTLEKGTAVSASAINFTVAAPAKINMTADLLNNKYGSPFALTFDKIWMEILWQAKSCSLQTLTV